MPTHTYNVKMTCGGCSGAVDKVLGKLKGKGVDDYKISLDTQTVEVVSETMNSNEILDVLKKTGKECTHVKST